MLFDDSFYTDFETSKLLAENGFNEWCDVFWGTGAMVRDEILEQYPGLSDDGYYELTNLAGGDLAWEDVYTNDWHLDNWNNNNSSIEECFGCNGYSAPLIQQALAYIRKKYNYEIEVMTDDKGFIITPIEMSSHECLVDNSHYNTWEESMNAGIRDILSYIIELNDYSK